MSQAPEPSAWAKAMTQLGVVGDELVAAMRARGEPLDAEVYLTILGSLMNAYLTRIAAERDHPVFVPCCGYFQRLGFPNPDTVYRSAPIADDGIYRLTGNRGTAWQITIMPFTAMMQSTTPLDLDDIAGDDGSVDLVVSRERPEGYIGAWWKLKPGWASLWLRSVSDRWGEEREPQIAIERLDVASRRRPSGDAALAHLTTLGMAVQRGIEYGIKHVDELAAEGFVNQLKTVDYGANGGMPLQSYHEGLYDLAEGEALVVEAVLPEGCDYFSWSLTDRMLVTLDWTHAPSSLNRSQAQSDDDGVLRVVVADSDPGIANWMDTAGYPRGVLQCRFIGSVDAPTMTTRVVPIAALSDHLPATTARITPDQRAAALHKRRTGFQLRTLW